MRERLMKVYAILLGLALLFFGVFFLKKGFVGKNVGILNKVNAQLDAAAHPNDTENPQPGAPTAVTAPTQTPNATPPPAVGATPAAGATPAPEPTPTPALPPPAKDGLGDAMKKIIERRDGQRKQLENSLNPPE